MKRSASDVAAERRLLMRVKGGDRRAQDQLIARFDNLIRGQARKFQIPGYDLDDCLQVARLAVIEAARRFDLSRELCFSTFVVPFVFYELTHARRSVIGAYKPTRERRMEASRPSVRLDTCAAQYEAGDAAPMVDLLVDEHAASPEATAIANIWREQLAAAIQPGRTQHAVRLFLAGLSVAEIAFAMGLTNQGASNLLTHGRRILSRSKAMAGLDPTSGV